MNQKLFTDRAQWRAWLEQNHARETIIWLVYYKKHVDKPSISYEEAVEEALCFGWIDSTVRRIDDQRHMQRFTPRKKNSNWAASNRERVARLLAAGRMAPSGMAAVEEAKRDGSWERLMEFESGDNIPNDLSAALAAEPDASKNFYNFTRAQRAHYLWWLADARRAATRQKRLEEIVRRSGANIKPG